MHGHSPQWCQAPTMFEELDCTDARRSWQLDCLQRRQSGGIFPRLILCSHLTGHKGDPSQKLDGKISSSAVTGKDSGEKAPTEVIFWDEGHVPD